MTRFALGLGGLLVAAALVFVGYRASRNVSGWALSNPKPVAVATAPASDQTITVTINKGENARTIGDKLQRAGVIRSSTWFRILAEIDGVQNSLAAGTYTFRPNSDTQAILDRVKTGILEPQILVTIPEGLRIEQVAALLDKKGVLKAQPLLDAMQSAGFTGELLKDKKPDDPIIEVLKDKLPGSSLEGYVFPDTYYFPAKTTPLQVLDEMVGTLPGRFDAGLRAAIAAEGLTYYQALTIASIVEREAQVPAERPRIASVFLNRLKQGIPLQADPTVQYAVAQDANSVNNNGWWKRDLTVDDLKLNSPYNTYVTPALPAGPICNPGRDSIAAVAHPEQTTFLYFVAKGDGSHAFASTLEEHNANIQKYQKR